MYEALKDLHRKFYTRAVMPELKDEYDDALRQLMLRWVKLDRKLALGLITELQHYEEERPEEALAVLCATGGNKMKAMTKFGSKATKSGRLSYS